MRPAERDRRVVEGRLRQRRARLPVAGRDVVGIDLPAAAGGRRAADHVHLPAERGRGARPDRLWQRRQRRPLVRRRVVARERAQNATGLPHHAARRVNLVCQFCGGYVTSSLGHGRVEPPDMSGRDALM